MVQAVNFLTAQREAAQSPTESVPAPKRVNGAAKPEAPVATPESIPEPVEPQPPEPGCVLSFLEHDLRIIGLEPDRPNLPTIYALHGSVGLICRGNWDTVQQQARKQAGGDLGAFVVQQPRPSNDPRLLAPNR